MWNWSSISVEQNVSGFVCVILGVCVYTPWCIWKCSEAHSSECSYLWIQIIKVWRETSLYSEDASKQLLAATISAPLLSPSLRNFNFSLCLSFEKSKSRHWILPLNCNFKSMNCTKIERSSRRKEALLFSVTFAAQNGLSLASDNICLKFMTLTHLHFLVHNVYV